MRSVTPQISVQMANSSPYQAGNATNAQRAHLAAQAAHAHQQHLQGQMIQQVRPPPTQAQAAAQSHATMFQTVASDLGIANCHPQVLNNALWATGLANRHPESWNDAEKVSPADVTFETKMLKRLAVAGTWKLQCLDRSNAQRRRSKDAEGLWRPEWPWISPPAIHCARFSQCQFSNERQLCPE